MGTARPSERPRSSGTLAAAVDDEAVREIVRRNSDRHAITRDDLDVEPAKAAADPSEERVALVALDPEMPTSERLDYLTLNLNQIVSCHSQTSLPSSRGGVVVTTDLVPRDVGK